MNLQTAILQGTKLLEEARVHAPRLTAEVLLTHALRCDRLYLFRHPEAELSEMAWIHYGRYLRQRLDGMPTQYITRRQEFYGREFRVTPDVLIPRPETELVVQAALPFIETGSVVVDVGAGSGAIGVTLALERPGAHVAATDISFAALQVAASNALRLQAKIDFLCADFLSPFAAASIDLIVSNPPYVGTHERDGLQREVLDHEPHVALFAGDSGNAMYARLIDEARRVLRPGGRIVFELGWKSLAAVTAMIPSGWAHDAAPDLAGVPRILTIQRP